jgi:hypothetical protein
VPRAGRIAALLTVAVLVPPLRAGERATPSAAPLLWRVEKGGRTSHLFGTVHVGLDLDTALQDAGRAALDRARRVFVELDLTSPSTMEAVAHDALARAELPPGQSLRALLRPEAWTQLTTLYRGRVPPAALDRMQPWFAAVSTLPLVSAPRRAEAVSSSRPLLDAAIAARARAHGIRVSALETPLQQIEVLVGMGRGAGVRMLEEFLRPSAHQEFDDLVEAYVAHDDRRLAKAFGRLWRRKPAFAERLLFRRNELWCERLGLWLGDGGIFVAVGGFHMFGDRGLVELLRRRGYRVERVRATPTDAGS